MAYLEKRVGCQWEREKMMGTSWTGSERFKRVGNSDDTIIIVTGATIHIGSMA